MATQNVKILIRRGLREQLSTEVLDTGEFGFTTDTNQLFLGIDPAINEIQFDPFINAHAIIQSWLDTGNLPEDHPERDCPLPGLKVDEDLVIRNIPTTINHLNEEVSGVQAVLEAMHFFTQEIDLVGNFNVAPTDTIYQRRFIFADVEADINALEPGKTYKILTVAPNSQDFFNDAAETVGNTYSKHDTFTVRDNYGTGTGQIPNLEPHNNSRVVEIIDTETYTKGVVFEADPYDASTNKKKIKVRVREGYPGFFNDNPYVNNYYHFNGDDAGNLKSDFGLFKWAESVNSTTFDNILLRELTLQVDADPIWVTQTILFPGETEVDSPINNVVYPADSFGTDGDFASTTYNNRIRFFQKVAGNWYLLDGATALTGELIFSLTEPTSANAGDIWVSYDETSTTSTNWTKQDISIIDEANYPDDIITVQIEGVEVHAPSSALFDNINVKDTVVVTASSKVTYWLRDEDYETINGTKWKLLGQYKYETAEVTLTASSRIHSLPTNLINAFEAKQGGYWKVFHTQNVGTEQEETTEIDSARFYLWYQDINNNGQYDDDIDDIIYGDIFIPYDSSGGRWEGDYLEDKLEVRYYFNDDFQFSSKPPMSYTNQDGTYVPPATRSNGDDPIEGDYYVYTDKDIYGGVNLNIFQWTPLDTNYQHNTVPVYYSDTLATTNATDGVLLYAMPYKFEDETLSLGILELRQRDYDTSEFWYPYEYSDILSYYFTLNSVPSVSDPDLTYAYSISGMSNFTVGHMGRARRNVEVITENSFNQLFADQHLSAQEEYYGLRPSLFRKIFEEQNGVFLNYNKMISSTFFVDYSLKQTTATKTFLRVGTLKIINGYPHDIPEIKLTDENTEIWHDNVILVEDDPSTTENEEVTMGNGDKIEDYDEFSNFVFETAVGVDENNVETNDLLIIYRQNPNCKTEVSYTIKRWTM